jgi:tetratricopeptide (TPR) repeat protein
MLEKSGSFDGAENRSVDEMIEVLRAAVPIRSPLALLSLASRVCRPLIETGDWNALNRVAAALTEMLNGTVEVKGRVDLWVASLHMEWGFAARVIERIESQPRGWESELAFDVRRSLWHLRAVALSQLGRYYEALSQMEELLELLSEHDTSEADRDAIRFTCDLLQATGAPAVSVQRLEVLKTQTIGEEQMLVLQSLAHGYRSLARHAEAVNCCELALQLATTNLEKAIPAAKALLGLELVLAKRFEDAMPCLIEVGDVLKTDRAILFVVACAWILILGQPKPFSKRMNTLLAQCRTAITRVYETLLNAAQHAEQDKDGKTVVNALRLRTLLVHVADLPDLIILRNQWISVCEIRDKYLQSPSAIEILALAELAYKRGNVVGGRTYLRRLPLGMAASLPGASWGGVPGLGHLGAASQGQAILLNTLVERVTDTVLARRSAKKGRTTVEDLRLLAETRRDALWRAQGIFSRPKAPILPRIRDGRSHTGLASLTPSAGRLAVIESLNIRNGTLFLITILDASGEVISGEEPSPENDLGGLAQRMQQRLNDWSLGRRGDPLDLPAWERLKKWLRELLGMHLSKNDHVVFIDSSGAEQLPWHVALADQWTCSYTTSWTRLLSFGRCTAIRRKESVGVAVVPQHSDSQAILQEMQSSRDRTRSLAANLGIRYFESLERECDPNALANILARTTVTKVLCHGFVSPTEHEVALMLAHDGALPPGVKVATNSQMARGHRFSWRDCIRLPSAPSVVFCAACSTGISHVIGFGEHLGLFAGLTSAGTRTMVAPRWDIVAASVLPILDDALERFFRGTPIGTALHTACRDAERKKRLPHWLAWALAVEGDWKCRCLSTNS